MSCADDVGGGSAAAYVDEARPEGKSKTSKSPTRRKIEYPEIGPGRNIEYPEIGHVSASPTDERIRQKAKLKAGHFPKARKQTVENNYDDCGTDLGGLAPYLLASMTLVGDDSRAD